MSHYVPTNTHRSFVGNNTDILNQTIISEKKEGVYPGANDKMPNSSWDLEWIAAEDLSHLVIKVHIGTQCETPIQWIGQCKLLDIDPVYDGVAWWTLYGTYLWHLGPMTITQEPVRICCTILYEEQWDRKVVWGVCRQFSYCSQSNCVKNNP